MFIVGAAKAGTTSLYHYLSECSEYFYMSPVKEPHFFTDVLPDLCIPEMYEKIFKSLNEYGQLFSRVKNESYICEASTSYLWDKNAPHRIKNYSPNAKVIIMLREPTSRAFSHYLNDVREGLENRSFWNAISEDFSAERKGWGVTHLYLDLGFYAEQVLHYLNVFGSNNIKIIFFEDFVKNPVDELEKLFDFLQLSRNLVNSINTKIIYNEYKIPRNSAIKSLLKNSQIRLAWRTFPKPLRIYFRDTFLFRKSDTPKIDQMSYEYCNQIYSSSNKRLKCIFDISIPWNL